MRKINFCVSCNHVFDIQILDIDMRCISDEVVRLCVLSEVIFL